MESEKLNELVSNPDNVVRIIDSLDDIFELLYIKYSLMISAKFNPSRCNNTFQTHCATSYYLNGHCASFANVLCEVFGNLAIKYNSKDHVIVKIGEHFYDARGLIDREAKNGDYHITTLEDLAYIDIHFGLKDSFEKPIEEELIKSGKEELNLLYEIVNPKVKKI